MDTTLLAYIPSPSQGVWHLGPIPLRAYALCIIVGIIVSVWWGDRRWRARGGQPGDVLDVALWAVPFGLVGGRLYHVATDWQKYFGDGGKGISGAVQIWDGGLGIWGAIAFGAVGAWIGCRWKGIKLPPFADALAPAILLAQAIGRLGNYFNQELYGEPTTLPWGLEIYQRVDSSGHVDHRLVDGVSTGEIYQVVHPTFLYELIWNVLIVVLLVVIDRYWKIGHGRLFALYVAGYCAGRFAIELMRTDPATHVLGLRINVLTSAIVFLLAALYVVLAPRGRETRLSMFRPDRAEELAELGEVGYLPPELDEDDDIETDGTETDGIETYADADDVEAADDAEAGETDGTDDEADTDAEAAADADADAEEDSGDGETVEDDRPEADAGALEVRYGGATLKQDPRSAGSTIEIRESTSAETSMVILDPSGELDEDLDEDLGEELADPDEAPGADEDDEATASDESDDGPDDSDDTESDETESDGTESGEAESDGTESGETESGDTETGEQ